MNTLKTENYLPVSNLAKEYGYDNVFDFLNDECRDSVVPACCIHGCEVEPDGRCEHNCPSPLLVMGFI